MDKNTSRVRRARRTRAKIRELGAFRLTIYRSPQHVYAQVFTAGGEKVVASASTLDKSVRAEISGSTGNKDAAAIVGRIIAERAKAAGVQTVAFDRAGYKFHGRIKALADAAREAGLEF